MGRDSSTSRIRAQYRAFFALVPIPSVGTRKERDILQDGDFKAAVEWIAENHNLLIRNLATHGWPACLLAEDEPFGHHVMYSLMDNGLAYSDLWARLKIVSASE